MAWFVFDIAPQRLFCWKRVRPGAGRKSLRAYSAPFDLRRFPPEKWVTPEKSLVWLADALDDAKHLPLVPKKNQRLLRKAAAVELRAMKIVEWKPPKKFWERG